MRYKVELVEAGSGHYLAKYVEDDEDLFVIQVGSGNWYLASDFFAMKSIKEFETIE